MVARLLLLVGVYAILQDVGARHDGKRPIEPSLESAKTNAFHIFNAIHSAGRQWGSALNHNGFGFIPAVLPRGTLLYHGSRQNHPPAGPQWLALEIEHAEVFSMSQKKRADEQSSSLHASDGDGQVRSTTPSSGDADNSQGGGNSRGCLHTYRTNRHLNLLYIDGLSAAKSKYGTLDSQDLLLCENKTGSWDDHMGGDSWRATSICRVVTDWGFDGFMRLELGFEIALCDFSTGIDMISAVRSFMPESKMGTDKMLLYQAARAVSREFNGLVDRPHLDFSAMISGFFFPINISSTDPARPDLIRLGAASLDHLLDIKRYLRGVSLQPRRFTVRWQVVVDSIVSRFADRLALMASGKLSSVNFINELERAILFYFDAPSLPDDLDAATDAEKNRTAEAIDRCTDHYLLSASLVRDDWSAEDRLIHTAVKTVTRDICHSLFQVRSSLVKLFPENPTDEHRIGSDDNRNELARAISDSRQVLRHLMERLAWTEWKKTRPCPVDQVLFVAMFPFGTKDDCWNPGCRTIQEMDYPTRRFGYWDLDYFVPNPPPPKEHDTEAELRR